jgi:biopolymer transport protein ExbD
MAFSSGSSSAPSSEINVTPLIDVLLVLMIIFMVVAPVTPRGLDSSIPQETSAGNAALPPVVVRLLAGVQGQPARYEVGQAAVEADALPGRLRAMFALRQDRTTFVQADRSLSYQDVAQVVSEAREAGAGAVVLSGLHP